MNLVSPIANAILKEGNYQETYGFNTSILGYKLFNQYFKERKKNLGEMQVRLRQKRQNLTQIKKKKRKKGLPLIDINSQIETLDGEKHKLERVQANICTPTKNKVRRIGYKNIISKKITYKGTNYLDLFSIKEHDGYYSPRKIHTIKGYNIPQAGFFEEIENTLDTLKYKYMSKKKKRKYHKKQ
jgi:hypothetical protein